MLAGRPYGGEDTPEHLGALKNMRVPAEMDALVETLEGRSRLLALPATSPEETIHDAYGHDLELLARYRAAFKGSIEAAVYARANVSHRDAHAFLARLVEHIGDIAADPMLDLGTETLKLAPRERLLRLQDGFRSDARDLASAVAAWLHALAEGDYVSVVEWYGPKAARYHFFLMNSKRDEIDRTVHDPGWSLTGRTVTTTITTRVEVFDERRVHTIVNAHSNRLDEYRDRVPKRIARLIDAIAPEIKPFVTIIDGKLSQEEVVRRGVLNKIETEKHSVWVNDPAPVLFNTWALAGWGGTTQERARSLFQGHVLERANKLLFFSVVATLACAAAAASKGIRFGITVAVLGLVLTALHQIGLRIEMKRNPAEQ
jgi:hypothetical protein